MKMDTILIVDDDPAIRKFVGANLEARGYKVLQADDGEKAMQVLEEETPDLILLDIMMPRMNGLEVCRKVREWSKMPIIILSARESENDKVNCLDYGADDYLTKPFSLVELLSRVKAVLRRTRDNSSTAFQPKYTIGDLEVDLNQNKAWIKKQELVLSDIQFNILAYLIANAGRIIAPDQILKRVWGEDYIGDSHLVQVNIARLRKRLGELGKDDLIETRTGIGYVIQKPD
jgi:DNA-binding response OmpR family regulator